ncbi:Protein of unknown function [Gryllus bimaculatus]|nr:Protein of unknown function [Gryllus bimaculatus]
MVTILAVCAESLWLSRYRVGLCDLLLLLGLAVPELAAGHCRAQLDPRRPSVGTRHRLATSSLPLCSLCQQFQNDGVVGIDLMLPYEGYCGKQMFMSKIEHQRDAQQFPPAGRKGSADEGPAGEHRHPKAQR